MEARSRQTRWKPILLLLTLSLGLPSAAFGFCGFYVAGGEASLYNDATQVVLMRHKQRTVLSMQNNYQGPAEDFAMVVPVPQVLKEKQVKTLDKKIFDRVDRLSAPRLVEYWERDPCAPDAPDFRALQPSVKARSGILQSMGAKGGGYVEVKAAFAVGEYDIVILDTNDATALDGWLKGNGYKIPAGAEPYFRPYIEQGDYFFVAKVNAEKVTYKDGKAVLSPLRFDYTSKKFQLPIRLGMINSNGQQDLLVYILAPNQRYDVANYKSVTIPTNIDVGQDVKKDFGAFYEALFSRTVEENPGSVVTEYAWAAQKCDPCPANMVGGAALRPQDLSTFGNDLFKVSAGLWGSTQWVLTRLHARYEKDQIGEDLVFKKVPGIVGGRELKDANGNIEKRSSENTTNNFQGRYIMRNHWEGDIACENPVRGRWQGPPNAAQMQLMAETIVTEMRRAKASAQGREPTAEELAAPRSKEELTAVAFQMRRKFGTSVAPGTSGGTLSAPSTNTRGPGIALTSGLPLATLVREAIPEIKVTPRAAVKTESKEANSKTDGETQGKAENGQANSGKPPGAADKNPASQTKPAGGCTSAPVGTSFDLAFWGVALILLRRRKTESCPRSTRKEG